MLASQNLLHLNRLLGPLFDILDLADLSLLLFLFLLGLIWAVLERRDVERVVLLLVDQRLLINRHLHLNAAEHGHLLVPLLAVFNANALVAVGRPLEDTADFDDLIGVGQLAEVRGMGHAADQSIVAHDRSARKHVHAIVAVSVYLGVVNVPSILLL